MYTINKCKIGIMNKMMFLVLVIFFYSFSIPKNLEKRINKEILSVFEINSYEKELIEIEQETQDQLHIPFNKNNFYKVLSQNEHLGFYFYGTAPSKTDYFDYVVIFDKELIVKKIKILAYREDYGGEIGSKRWLNQFNKFSKNDEAVYQGNIKAISGATISARSMTNSINDLLRSLEIIQNKIQQ